MKFLQGKKTYVIAGLMVLVGVVNMLTGDPAGGLDLVWEQAQVILAGLGFAALRAGVG